MHPAYSVIFFTTASGAGYGLLALLGIFAGTGLLPAGGGFAVVALGLALGLITGGLLSSTFHLTHPERAWRAVSQWRSSWLSREGVLALATFVPAGLFALGWLLDGPVAVPGLVSAVLAAATVWCTAMIYASLRAVRQWNTRWVPAVYLALSAATGALLLSALVRLWGGDRPELGILTALLVAGAWAVKAAYWQHIDGDPPRHGLDEATGLNRIGPVHLLEKPHTEENFVMRELGYQVARTHAARLRRIVHVALFAVPLVLTVAGLWMPLAAGAVAAVVAVAIAAVGVLAERWLFFAEARHTAMLYYGQAA